MSSFREARGVGSELTGFDVCKLLKSASVATLNTTLQL